MACVGADFSPSSSVAAKVLVVAQLAAPELPIKLNSQGAA